MLQYTVDIKDKNGTTCLIRLRIPQNFDGDIDGGDLKAVWWTLTKGVLAVEKGFAYFPYSNNTWFTSHLYCYGRHPNYGKMDIVHLYDFTGLLITNNSGKGRIMPAGTISIDTNIDWEI